MIVVEIFIFFVTFLVIELLWQQRRFFYLASKIPKSNFDFSWRGIVKFLTADCRQLFEMSYESFKDTKGTVKTWLGPVLMVIVGHPKDVKIILKSKKTIEKPGFIKFFGANESTLFGDYGPWNSHKKLLNPYFSVNGVKSFIPLFNEKVKIFIKRVEEMEGKGEFDVFYYLTALSLETILKVMDYEVDVQNMPKEERESFIIHLRSFFKAVSLRIFKPWLHPKFIYERTTIYADQQEAISKSAMKFTRKIMDNFEEGYRFNGRNLLFTNDEYKLVKKGKNVFLEELYNNNLSDKEIFDEVKTLLVAAQDTTALSSSSVLLLLAMHKPIQDKVADELLEVFGNSKDPYICQEKLNKLHFLEMVINEAMRLTPVVPVIFRKVSEEIKLSNCLIVPRGANIIIPIVKMHRDKEIWGSDAEEFRPERFKKENFKNIHPFAFIPFTKGPRMCLGYRYALTLMKIQLVNFLMKYEVKTSLKFKELEFELNTTMNVCQGYMISIEKRH